MAFRVIVDGRRRTATRRSASLHAAYPMVPGPLQGLHLDAQAQRLPVAAHRRHRPAARSASRCRSAPREMHEVAEYGVAAHWIYKQGQAAHRRAASTAGCASCSTSWSMPPSPEEFLEHTKLEMFQDQVFCFTPKGDLIALPRGATPVDFAYAVHSRGRRHTASAPRSTAASCRCAPQLAERRPGRDHHLARRRRRRRPGNASSSPARRGRASAASSAPSSATQYVELGRAMLQKAFQQDGYEFAEKALDGVLKKFKADERRRPDRARSARGSSAPARSSMRYSRAAGRRRRTTRSVPLRAPAAEDPEGRRRAVPISGLIPGMAVHFAGCCHPLPGDRIVGIVTTGKGVTIHTIDCDTLESFADTPERWIDVAWDVDPAAGECPYRPAERGDRQSARQPGHR